MSFPRRALAATVRPVGAAIAVGSRVAKKVGVAAAAPVRLVIGLDRVVGNLDDIAVGVRAMNGEFVGMRADILVLDERVEALREEISRFRGEIAPPVADVPPMLAGVEALDTRLGALAQQLESVDALALRLGRLGRVRVRAKNRGQDPSATGPVPGPATERRAEAS